MLIYCLFVLQFGIVDADGGLSLWQTNTSGNAPKPYLVRDTSYCFLLLSNALSFFFTFISVLFLSSLLPSLLLNVYFVSLNADASVSQQDGSRLGFRRLLVPHCHGWAFYRQQVQTSFYLRSPVRWPVVF